MGTATGLLVANLAAGGAELGSSVVQANAMRAQGKYQKQQLDANARLEDLRAQDAIQRGDYASQQHLSQTRGLIGAQRAAFAAQGVEVDSGSALDIQEDTAALGAVDALMLRNNAWREAWGHRVQATDLRGQGYMARLAANNAARNTIATGGLAFARGALQGAYMYDQTKVSKAGSEPRKNATILPRK